MPINWTPGHKAQLALLEAFAQITERAIGLFEPASDDNIREILPTDGFESYCRKIQGFNEGKHRCQKDHIERARRVMESSAEELTLCYAGVFNQALPIVVDDEVKAVLMYGQMWVEGDDRCEKARKRHESTIARLKQTEDDELELRVYYDEIKRFSANDLDALNQRLFSLQHSFYEMLSEEQERTKQAESIIHELQIRLQPILAEAENLYYDLCRTGTECRQVKRFPSAAEELFDQAKRSSSTINKLLDRVEHSASTAKELLNSVLAMHTLVRNFGAFMPEEYQFKPCPLDILVEQAIALYSAEAERRGIAILPQLEKSPEMIKLSRIHLQEAINNLTHNAIKYSFRGTSDRHRFVEIEGKTIDSNYELTFANYGVGILPEEIDRIFEPGYKGKLTHKEYRSGSGMGLAIAKEIIENHRGTIKAQSKKTEGDAYVNKFIVCLPIEQPKGEENENRLD